MTFLDEICQLSCIMAYKKEPNDLLTNIYNIDGYPWIKVWISGEIFYDTLVPMNIYIRLRTTPKTK